MKDREYRIVQLDHIRQPPRPRPQYVPRVDSFHPRKYEGSGPLRKASSINTIHTKQNDTQCELERLDLALAPTDPESLFFCYETRSIPRSFRTKDNHSFEYVLGFALHGACTVLGM